MIRRIPQELKDEAVELYLTSELPAREVAARYGVCERTFFRWVADYRARRGDLQPVA